MAGWIIAGRGIAYIPLLFAHPDTYTTSYQIQNDIAPLWMYALVQIGLSVLVLRSASLQARMSWRGRFYSVLSFSAMVLLGTIWVESRAWIAVSTCVILAVVMLVQSIYVPEVRHYESR